MYAAFPMTLPGGGRGAARLAVPLDEVEATVGAVRHILWGALAIALVVALVASTTVAQLLSRALRRMTDAARRMAAGDLAVRLRPPGTDEISELGRAFDTMATSLAATLATLRGERDLLGLILESMREGVLVLDQQGLHPAGQSGAARDAGHSLRRRRPRGAGTDPERGAAVDPGTRARGGRPRLGRDRNHRTAAAAPAGPRRAAADGCRQAPGPARRVRRCERDAAAGDTAQGLRRQRVSRAAHADHRRAIGGRHLAADADGRSDGVGAFRRHHRPQRPAPGRAGRGPARFVAHRVQGLPPGGAACLAARGRRPGADHAARAHRREVPRRGQRDPVGAAAGARRPARPGAGVHQPARQRGQILPARARASA